MGTENMTAVRIGLPEVSRLRWRSSRSRAAVAQLVGLNPKAIVESQVDS